MIPKKGVAAVTEIGFAEMDTSVDYYIGEPSELEIEAMLLDRLKSKDRTPRDNKIIATQKEALREIDRLKIAATYQEERDKIRRTRLPETNFNLPKPAPEFMDRLRNFTAGLRSIDPDQRGRFQRFSQNFGLGSRTPREAADYLWALEPATDGRERGRPKVNPPWAGVDWALGEMRIKVAAGLDIVEVSQRIALEEGRPGVEERAKYFRRLYRKRQKLRE